MLKLSHETWPPSTDEIELSPRVQLEVANAGVFDENKDWISLDTGKAAHDIFLIGALIGEFLKVNGLFDPESNLDSVPVDPLEFLERTTDGWHELPKSTFYSGVCAGIYSWTKET